MNGLSVTSPPGYDDVPIPVKKPLTFWSIALAVFVGNAITGVVAALVYALATH